MVPEGALVTVRNWWYSMYVLFKEKDSVLGIDH